MASNRFLQGRGGSIVHERLSKSQSPQWRRTNFVRLCNSLGNSVSGSDIVEEQVRKKVNRLLVEQGIGITSRNQDRSVARGAADFSEERFAGSDVVVDGTSRHRRQQSHEI